MANTLDLEEQEQVDQIKAFWQRWGDLISWILIACLAVYAGYNGWQYWQRQQAAKASAMYDELDVAAQAGDIPRVERAMADLLDKHGSSVYAAQGVLMAAKALDDKGQPAAAAAALAKLVDKAPDDGYRAVARLRDAAMLTDLKKYDEAVALLSQPVPVSFAGLVADRKADILRLQGKNAEARAEYEKAWRAMEEGSSYRQLVAVKLNGLGVDVKALEKVSSGSAKS